MKKISLIIVAMLLPMMASALAFTVNGLSYEHLGGLTQAVRLIGYVTEECPSDVIIPATVSDGDRTYSVDNISSGAFWGCTNLRSVFMENDAAGNGVKYIDANSFSGCTNLKYVHFSKTLNAILGPGWSHEIGAFEGCTSLESIYLPASMNYLIDENVTAPHNICKWAFKNCTNLKTVVIAAKKPYIEDEAFINCPSLSCLISYVNPPYQLADNTFKGLSSNASLIVPDGTKSGYQSFAGWSDFRNIYEHGSYTNAFAFVTATQGGKVTYSGEDVSKGTQVWSITKGQSASFTITPDGGHRLQKLYKDGQDVTSNVIGGTYTVSNVQNDFTLEAVFVEGTEPQPQPTTQDKGTAKLSIEAFDIKAGETKTMLIDMQNPEDLVTMVQFDLRLPDGLSIATGDDAIDIAGRTTWKKHTLTSNATNGITRLLLYSGTNDVIEGTSGAIISIKIVASSSFNGGDIKLENQLMTTPILVESKPATYIYTIKGESVNPPVGDTEPYAVYNDGVLTFYCDNQRSSRQGTAYDLNTGFRSYPGWYEHSKSIIKAVFDASFADARPATTFSWFYECSSLTEIEGLGYLNTSEVIYMAYMFRDCDRLNSLDLSKFDTKNVVLMSRMFHGCSSLTNLDVTSFDTRNVTDMWCMFYGCKSLTSLDVSNFNTRNVTQMHGMFQNCPNLKTIYANEVLWNTDNVTEGGKMFSQCTNLVGGNGTKYDNEHTDVEYARIDKINAPGYLTNKDYNNPPVGNSEPYVVYNDYTLTFYCDDQRSSRIGTTYSLNEGEKEPDWVLDDNNRNIEKVVFDASFAKARPTSTFQWFFYFDYLTEIKGIENLNTSEVRNMRAMFFSCRRLKSIEVSHFDTKAVEDMGGMFSNCTNLESINVSHFNTSNVYNMASMFNECQSLTDLDLSNFYTGKAEYLPYLFSGCSNLRTLYLGSGFTSSSDVLCEEAFADCQSLSKVVFTGDIPASINSEFFKGVGTADAPAKLDVPEQFEANFAAKFNGNMFYGGYFILRETIVPNAEDGSKDYSSGNSEIDEMTDLNGTIIGNVYYSIAPGDGGYNSAEGCLVVSKPSPDVDYDYEDPFDEEFKNMFTGIVIMVQPGSGTVKVEAETSEGMSLMVKIGNNLSIKMTLQTKSTLAIPYTVTRPTYVYIYAGGGNSTRVSSDGALKIYGFSWESSSTGINAPIATDDQAFDVYSLSGTMMKKGTRSLESLPKGVYIVNGRKFVKK